MPALSDVNVLLALVTDLHAHHAEAVHWLHRVATNEAVICRIAQTGLMRLLNNPAVMREEALDTAACWELWRRLLEDERLRFSPHEPLGLDAAFERFTSGREYSPRLWTDAYLAAYAVTAGMTLVTFDKKFGGFPGLDCLVLRPRHESK